MLKKELRNRYIQLRNEISPIQKKECDAKLLLQLKSIWSVIINENLSTLLNYYHIQKNNEPDTLLFAKELCGLMNIPRIAYPCSDFIDYTMSAVLCNDETAFIEKEFGIIEPTSGEIIEPASIDIVFVPMLICDIKGYRVGYGKGFYDRYLAQCRSNVLKIGFSYFKPVESIDDTTAFDIPLNYCITPEATYEF